jgi:EAL and modified HD-GYP domain-containing signal transduction protein
MCELLARQAKLPPDQLFTAGLLSLLDAILDRPLHEILQQLNIAPLIHEALEGGTSAAGKIIDTARNQNRGDLHKVSGAGFDAQAIFVAWFESVRWADEVISKI